MRSRSDAAERLRRRILAGLASTSLVAAACHGQTEPTTSTSSSSGSTSSSGASSGASSGTAAANCGDRPAERTCFAPDAVIRRGSGYGGALVPDAAPLPPPVVDANGCPVADEVIDGCCNSAVTEPELEAGRCCYTFCAGACCGRPLRGADERAIVAETTRRDDWSASSAGFDLGALDERTRRAVLRAYTEDALLEHASIASFALLAIELLALGAPPELVALAQEASLDEVRHARETFAVASALAGEPVGPGPLPIPTSLAPKTDLATLAAACVRDGCVGETIASLVADAQADRARCPAVRDVLRRIAADEARHAELAFRVVAWALSRGGEPVATAVREAFACPRPAPAHAGDDVDTALLLAAGRLDARTHLEVVARAEREVLGPCAAALLVERHVQREGACRPSPSA